MVAGQDLQTDGQPVDQSGRDAHRRAAVEIRRRGEGGVVHDGARKADLVDEIRPGEVDGGGPSALKATSGVVEHTTKSASAKRSAIASLSWRR